MKLTLALRKLADELEPWRLDLTPQHEEIVYLVLNKLSKANNLDDVKEVFLILQALNNA